MVPEREAAPDRARRLDEAVADYLDAADRGSAPDRGAWLARHPDLAGELSAVFDGLDFIDGLTRPLREPPGGDSPAPLPPATGRPAGPPPGAGTLVFGDYEIQGELGVGGMGVVYRARQVSLNRPVALKMIRAGAWATEAEVARFRNEAEAAAGLDHPHVVPVYEVGREQGQLYYTMRLVEGTSLAERLSLYRGKPDGAVRLMSAVARAVHHAHQRGVLHRDLKPSNILVDRDGVPYVTDFGLAKRPGGGLSLTQTGALVGTPGYLPPERARGRGPDSVAGDVYGLGAVLYALLAGRPPFRGCSALEILEQTRTREPPPLTGAGNGVDRDLDTVCRRCLEKDPSRRYASAQALADDLQRWLDGKPVQARRPTVAWRLRLWFRRRGGRRALGVAVPLLLVAALAAAVGLAGREWGVDPARRARPGEPDAEVLRQLYATDIALAQRAWLQGDAAGPGPLLDRWRPDPAAGHRADFAWRLLDSLRQASDRAPPAPGWPPCSAPGGEEARFPLHVGGSGGAGSVAFSPDGRTLAVVENDGSVSLRDARTGREPPGAQRLRYAGVGGCVVRFEPGGRALVLAGPDGGLRRWFLDGAPRSAGRLEGPGTLAGPGGAGDPPLSLCGRPGSAEWAVCVRGAPLLRWDATAGRCLRPFFGDEHCGCAAWSPDGTALAAILARGVCLLRREAGAAVELFPSGAGRSVTAVAFSPDGAAVATADSAGVIRLWESAGARPGPVLAGHPSRVNGLAFSPDGRLLASGGAGGDVKVWHLGSRRELLTLPASASGEVTDVAFSPDGVALAAAYRRPAGAGGVALWVAAPP